MGPLAFNYQWPREWCCSGLRECPPAAATSGALASHVTAGIFLCNVEIVASFCFAFHWNILPVKAYCRLFEIYVYTHANTQHRVVKVVCTHLVSDVFFSCVNFVMYVAYYDSPHVCCPMRLSLLCSIAWCCYLWMGPSRKRRW